MSFWSFFGKSDGVTETRTERTHTYKYINGVVGLTVFDENVETTITHESGKRVVNITNVTSVIDEGCIVDGKIVKKDNNNKLGY